MSHTWWQIAIDSVDGYGFAFGLAMIGALIPIAMCVQCFKRCLENDREMAYSIHRGRIEAKTRPLHPYYKALYAEKVQVQVEQVGLLEPPLPLSCDVGPEHFDASHNTDFRKVQESGKPYFRGGARYTRPLGAYRHALAVLGKYPGDDAWLACIGCDGEWQVAFHGTTCENISGILNEGFDLERCRRFTYGKGIYCSPDPRVAMEYSTAYESQDRWYKAVLQVRVHPSIKRIVFAEGKEDYWIVPVQQAIRPYGVCVYDVTR